MGEASYYRNKIKARIKFNLEIVCKCAISTKFYTTAIRNDCKSTKVEEIQKFTVCSIVNEWTDFCFWLKADANEMDLSFNEDLIEY